MFEEKERLWEYTTCMGGGLLLGEAVGNREFWGGRGVGGRVGWGLHSFPG